MSNEISNTDNTIDSRDVIARIEELEAEQEELKGEWDGASELDAPAEFLEWEKEFGKELDALRELASEAEASPDWEHGEILINEDYFTDYIEELINDCYDMPKEMNSGEWPWRHVTIDYEATAQEAKVDYIEVDFDGSTYLIRA